VSVYWHVLDRVVPWNGLEGVEFFGLLINKRVRGWGQWVHQRCWELPDGGD